MHATPNRKPTPPQPSRSRPNLFSRPWLLAAAGLVVSVLLAGLWVLRGSPVETVKVGNSQAVVVGSGALESRDTTTLEATTDATVIRAPFSEGSAVHRGDLLMQLQPASREDSVPVSLFSPHDGTVTHVYATIGEAVKTGMPLVQVTASTARIVLLELDADLAAAIPSGQMVELRADTHPDQPFAAKVISRERSGRKTKLLLDATPWPAFLETGMAMSAIFPARAEAAWLLPRRALVMQGEQASVWQLDGKTVHLRPVQVGSASGLHATITEGLTTGDIIVLPPATGLTEGQRVRSGEPRTYP